MEDKKRFHLQVITPERMFYDGDVEMIELCTSEGEAGILPEHIPLTTVVVPGVLRIIKGEEVKEAALHDGFIEILKKKVTILAESCEWPGEIDVKRANEAKNRAENRIRSGKTEVNITRAEAALRRSLIRLNLVEKSKG